MTRPIAVFDIDGVLADTSHRIQFIKPAPGVKKSWKDFFAQAVNDAPLPEGVALLQTLSADHDIVFLTGRPEQCRVDTEAWLRANVGVEPTRLYMRRPNTFTPSAVEKTALLAQLAAEGREIAIIIDDDPSVVASYREEGFNVVHATWAGEYDEATAAGQQRDGRF